MQRSTILVLLGFLTVFDRRSFAQEAAVESGSAPVAVPAAAPAESASPVAAIAAGDAGGADAGSAAAGVVGGGTAAGEAPLVGAAPKGKLPVAPEKTKPASGSSEYEPAPAATDKSATAKAATAAASSEKAATVATPKSATAAAPSSEKVANASAPAASAEKATAAKEAAPSKPPASAEKAATTAPAASSEKAATAPKASSEVAKTSKAPPSASSEKGKAGLSSKVEQKPVVAEGTPVVGAADAGEYDAQILREHNKLRKWHCSPPLEINKTLSDTAQAWATKMATAGSISFNPKNTEFGESVWEGKAKPKGRNVVDKWYMDFRRVKPGNGQSYFSAPEYTQLLWKETKSIGVGLAQGSDKKWYSAVYYYPKGNKGEAEVYVQNVQFKNKRCAGLS